MGASRPILTIAIEGPLSRTGLPALAERFCAALTAHRPAQVICEVHGVAADAVAVEALARMQLAARQHGCRVRLRGASAELRELIAFMGLRDVLPE